MTRFPLDVSGYTGGWGCDVVKIDIKYVMHKGIDNAYNDIGRTSFEVEGVFRV